MTALPPLKDGSRGILYQCRMQYLKSREGRDNSRKTRRKGVDEPFSCLDERVHGPCSSDILLPPSELMTRSEAFRFAYWKHHREPTMRSIKKLEFGHDESHERLSKKRKEILSRIEASNRAKKELELRRRAERVMNHSLESMDDDSVEESDAESSFVQSNLPQLPSQDQDDHTAMSPLSVSNRRKGSRASMLSGVKREDTAKTILPPISSKRSTMIKRIDDSRGKENTNSAFSFLSEWGNVKVKD